MSAEPVSHVEVRRAYADSVALLQVSRDVAALPGVRTAQVAMGTPLNLELLAGMGFTVPSCTSDDLVVAVRVDSEDVLGPTLDAVTAALAPPQSGGQVARPAGGPGSEAEPPRTTRTALRGVSGGLALVSVPGSSAAVEAMDALDEGCDVMVFSDNVPVEQEVALKHAAADRGLLVMGPDCGTAVLGGVGLGFANVVDPGEVGIVAASGTGCQQLMALLAAAGVGVGAALGVGGRDLSAAVGGLATREALRRLEQDPSVSRIVVVSKPPDPEVAARVEAWATALTTPVHLALLGPERPTLTEVAESVVRALGRPVPDWPVWGAPATRADGRFLRGLFVGGTLCEEAMVVAGAVLGPIRSNVPLSPDLALDGSMTAAAHLVVDFGDDALTRGRAHPMIDPTLRLELLRRHAANPDTGVLMLDVVLGHGADPDPAESLAPALHQAVVAARDSGRTLPVVVTCVGTEQDPQGLTRQAEALADAGAEVFLSNEQAAARAAAYLSAGSPGTPAPEVQHESGDAGTGPARSPGSQRSGGGQR